MSGPFRAIPSICNPEVLGQGNSLKCIFDEPTYNVNQTFNGKPGQDVSADEQCRVFLKVENC